MKKGETLADVIKLITSRKLLYGRWYSDIVKDKAIAIVTKIYNSTSNSLLPKKPEFAWVTDNSAQYGLSAGIRLDYYDPKTRKMLFGLVIGEPRIEADLRIPGVGRCKIIEDVKSIDEILFKYDLLKNTVNDWSI